MHKPISRAISCAALFLTLLKAAAGQQTVGLFLNSPSSFNGYTLFAPTTSKSTYLIDNCGELVNSWESAYPPGMSAYLLEDGSLVRSARIPSNFSVGGSGGRVERFDWEGNLVWAFNYSSDTFHQHHDFVPLPNGNLLLLAWEFRSMEAALENGRDPALISPAGVWSEQVVEVHPFGSDSGAVVWEWHLWDHLVQDFDSTKANFGSVADHPERLDINFEAGNTSQAGFAVDWIHANAINYNPELDQVLLSSRNLHEIWVIDHSTTTEEAAGHSGGLAGKGGDLLFRWGNPQSYRRGTAADRRFFGQHDARWIPAGVPGAAGRITVFNNGLGRPTGNFSSVDELVPPLSADGSYVLENNSAFGPDDLSWTFVADPPASLFSGNISGAQRLPNGNTLICEGGSANFMEITGGGELVWRYVNPVNNFGPTVQGQTPGGNAVFRALRYPPDFAGLAGKDLTPNGPIELNPLPSNCELFSNLTGLGTQGRAAIFSIKSQLVGDELELVNESGQLLGLGLISPIGRVVVRCELFPGETKALNISHLPAGMYFVSAAGKHAPPQKIVKAR